MLDDIANQLYDQRPLDDYIQHDYDTFQSTSDDYHTSEEQSQSSGNFMQAPHRLSKAQTPEHYRDITSI
jgi:hypothetical protein